jgi:hypothetical protein
MKRKPDELFYDYCARRLMEKEVTKELLRPRMVHVSSALVPHPGKEYKDIPSITRPLVRIKVNGTWRKPKKGGGDAVS